jgi:tetrapyrrole methylase family protein/MazG family protein
MTAHIVVVGVGPGGDDHVTTEVLTAIERATHRFVRTARHPSMHHVGEATSFDELYEHAATFADVYAEIVEILVAAAAAHGEVLYAVPGSPLVLEHSVRLLVADGRVATTVLPAMSFLDVAWARLGVDPVEAGVRLVDGHDFATAAAGDHGPLLIAHAHANWVLSEIKLSVDTGAGEDEVVILQRLGTPDEAITRTTWAELDRAVDADHLTSVYVPRLGVAVGQEYVRFHALTRTLREQCPWDREQDHRSLVPYLIEETYEVVDALQALDPDNPTTDDALVEELGDLLYQIEFHATIAEQQGRFTIADVAAGIHDKLVRRHPHVFGTVEVDGARQVAANWDAIKRAEKADRSPGGADDVGVFDGVAASLPALAYADKVQRRAAEVGFDWPDVDGALPKIAEEAAELVAARATASAAATADELGDLLFAVVNVARHLGVDPESALRAATAKFRVRFGHVERLARARGLDLGTLDLAALDQLWDEVKAAAG